MTARRAAATGSAADFLPTERTLPALRQAAARCRGCHLWQRATQTVFGAGPAAARLVLVGEQPGHEEDLAGAPFVGPAGRLLDRALEEAGIDRISSRWAPHVMATVHPSAILRAPDDETRRAEMKRFVADLANLREVLDRR